MKVEEIQTLQHLFDFIVEHMAKQKRRAFSAVHETCVYATNKEPYALKCAVGCLIDPKIGFNLVGSLAMSGFYGEGTKVWDVIPENIIKIDKSFDFLCSMQDAHDRSYDKNHLKNKLTEISTIYNLNNEATQQITEWFSK